MISDHNTLEGALRIAHEPDSFPSVEVTTRFPENDVTLHVLIVIPERVGIAAGPEARLHREGLDRYGGAFRRAVRHVR